MEREFTRTIHRDPPEQQLIREAESAAARLEQARADLLAAQGTVAPQRPTLSLPSLSSLSPIGVAVPIAAAGTVVAALLDLRMPPLWGVLAGGAVGAVQAYRTRQWPFTEVARG